MAAIVYGLPIVGLNVTATWIFIVDLVLYKADCSELASVRQKASLVIPRCSVLLLLTHSGFKSFSSGFLSFFSILLLFILVVFFFFFYIQSKKKKFITFNLVVFCYRC